MEFLSNIELYFAPQELIKENNLFLEGEEQKHITKVMRHSAGDEIYVTDGKGNIYKCAIDVIKKDAVFVLVKDKFRYEEKYPNVTFCIPKLRQPDRLEFALEKCTELGITNFIVFSSERTFTKGDKLERWNRILLAAMKQSLQSYLPKLNALLLDEIIKSEGEKIIFDQSAEKYFKDFHLSKEKKYYFIFGPEGGLSEKELNNFNKENFYKIAENRLRSETAVIKAASLM